MHSNLFVKHSLPHIIFGIFIGVLMMFLSLVYIVPLLPAALVFIAWALFLWILTLYELGALLKISKETGGENYSKITGDAILWYKVEEEAASIMATGLFALLNLLHPLFSVMVITTSSTWVSATLSTKDYVAYLARGLGK